jgi:hypothetical protein
MRKSRDLKQNLSKSQAFALPAMPHNLLHKALGNPLFHSLTPDT